jgi:hypothetical protein
MAAAASKQRARRERERSNRRRGHKSDPIVPVEDWSRKKVKGILISSYVENYL